MPTTEIYTLSLHDALPICSWRRKRSGSARASRPVACATKGGCGAWKPCACSAAPGANNRARSGSTCRPGAARSEEHTSELQSHSDLVCRLLLEKKKKKDNT